ncbi:hypothetical protein EDM57_04400 [Brevibacillus gelatini]|uniref:Uncharacterized protein n=1 Tax=Brevibacillus gelatini TaxID=1655277 RepID=A0A3M8B7N3_9BACL|nr:hypothetical protein [Brevibacillus gelatini]RNB59389.1 hypothetical protein EDM57_04400 [Brevibacillus gelatini]
MENKLWLVKGDDWEGLFNNGLLIDESHEILKSELVRYMQEYNTLDVEFLWLNNDGIEWLHDVGSLPLKFDEIPEEYFE